MYNYHLQICSIMKDAYACEVWSNLKTWIVSVLLEQQRKVELRLKDKECMTAHLYEWM